MLEIQIYYHYTETDRSVLTFFCLSIPIYNQFHNILRLLIFYQIFLSRQVKRSMINSNKHGIYELPYELPNNLKVRILGN